MDPDLPNEVESLLAQHSNELQNGTTETIATPASLESGRRLGPYELGAMLGSGEWVRFFAPPIRLHRPVAIKVLRQKASSDGTALERFRREARAASALNHPGICTVYDIGEANGQPFLVMEYLEGQTLSSVLEQGPLAIDTLVGIATDIAGALDAAHTAGIVHRDIKPANVFLTSSGQTKVLDFGIARMLDDGGQNSPLTEAGSAIGTVSYMSSEQARGEKVGAATDLYSLGVVLYEMATGVRPFRGSTTASLFDAILNREAVPIRTLRPELPVRMEGIVKGLLDKKSDSRLKSSPLTQALRELAEPPRKSARSYAVALAAVTFALAAAGLYIYLHRTPKLTDKDTLVVAEFENKTGDPVFDETLRQGISIQLEQSPFLSLIPDDRIQRVLPLMGKNADTRLTPTIAQEICERTASAAVIYGSIARLGSEFVLGLRAKSCRSGAVLAEEQAQAARKEDVLKVLSQIASRFRTRLGESLATVASRDIPLAEATTSSLEALKAYSQALNVLSSQGGGAAVLLFRRATDIDPQFAMAHARLGLSYATSGQLAQAEESFGKAMRLLDHASEVERFFIKSIYEIQVRGNLEKGEKECREWAEAYPRDLQPHGFLGAMVYPILGKYPQALEEAKTIVGLDPGFAIGYLQVAFNYAFLERMTESDHALRQAAQRKLEIPFMMQRFGTPFLEGDKAGMEREVARSRGNPLEEDWLDDAQAFVLAYGGRFGEAAKKSSLAVNLAHLAGERDREATWRTGTALREGFFGYPAAAKQSARAARDLSQGRDTQFGAAFALAPAGENSEAQKVAKNLEAHYPDDTAVKFIYLPALRGLLALPGDPANALQILLTASSYDLAAAPSGAVGFYGVLYPVYVRGLAYLANHQGREAAVEFQKFLDHPGLVVIDPVGALAHLELGRALALSGDKTGARKAYRDFLTLWKDADSDIPLLIQAKAEAARL